MATKETTKTSKYFNGTGRRKTAVARVRIFEGSKDVVINNKVVAMDDQTEKPFAVVGKKGNFGLSVKVAGGGKEGQKDAIVHGIARALVEFDPEFRSPLKKAGLLTRDPREVERKKPGLKKARRAPQWSKR